MADMKPDSSSQERRIRARQSRRSHRKESYAESQPRAFYKQHETARERRSKRIKPKPEAADAPPMVTQRRKRVIGRASMVEGDRRYMKTTPYIPPVLVRSAVDSVSLPSQRKTPRRRVDIPLGANGAEMRLPSLPMIKLGWRAASTMVVVLMLFSLFNLWKSPAFQVTEMQVEGLQRLTLSDIQTVTGLPGESIFSIDPHRLEDELLLAFPELASVSVEIDMPAQMKIALVERQPVMVWVQDGSESWVDENGYAFPQRGEAGNLVRVEANGLPRGAVVEESSAQVGIPKIYLPPEFIAAAQRLGVELPEGTPLFYDAEHGLGWNDHHGWVAFFGLDMGNVAIKQKVYQTLVQQLLSQDIYPTMISVENVHAPYYRMERERDG